MDTQETIQPVESTKELDVTSMSEDQLEEFLEEPSDDVEESYDDVEIEETEIEEESEELPDEEEYEEEETLEEVEELTEEQKRIQKLEEELEALKSPKVSKSNIEAELKSLQKEIQNIRSQIKTQKEALLEGIRDAQELGEIETVEELREELFKIKQEEDKIEVTEFVESEKIRYRNDILEANSLLNKRFPGSYETSSSQLHHDVLALMESFGYPKEVIKGVSENPFLHMPGGGGAYAALAKAVTVIKPALTELMADRQSRQNPTKGGVASHKSKTTSTNSKVLRGLAKEQTVGSGVSKGTKTSSKDITAMSLEELEAFINS